MYYKVLNTPSSESYQAMFLYSTCVYLIASLSVSWGIRTGSQQLQATWLPNSYMSTSANDVYNAFKALKDEGVQRVYVDVWNQGKVYFASDTMQTAVGDGGIGADHLQWALDAGNDLAIDVYAWFEYGFMCSYGSINNDFARYAEAQGWLLGQYSNFYWIDVANTDVLAFTAGIMSDAILTYGPKGLKGVQWDDHFSTPVELGRTVEDMDNAMAYMSAAQKAASQQSVMSLSPNTLSASLRTYNVDWNKWGSLGYYDEVIPQLYRTTFESFKSEFNYTLNEISESTNEKWIASGVRVDGSGDPTAWTEVNNMLRYSTTHSKGSVVWYSHGILELYPEQFKNVWT